MLDFSNEISTFLPHREPFLFIDEIKNIDIGKSIHCVKHNSPEEEYFKGHFPGNPIMPGVLILEALAQASGMLGFKTLEKTPASGSLYVFAGIDKARFRRRVGPNDSVDLFSKVLNEKRGIWKFETRAEVEGELACSATIMCADRKV